jgi:hypothetical protein
MLPRARFQGVMGEAGAFLFLSGSENRIPAAAARLLATESKRTAEKRAAVAADGDGGVPCDRVRFAFPSGSPVAWCTGVWLARSPDARERGLRRAPVAFSPDPSSEPVSIS